MVGAVDYLKNILSVDGLELKFNQIPSTTSTQISWSDFQGISDSFDVGYWHMSSLSNNSVQNFANLDMRGRSESFKGYTVSQLLDSA